MGTISDCWHLKVNLKEKILVNSTTQSFPKNIIKTFLIEDFFPFATGVNDTGAGAPWAANIYANFRKKIETALMVYLGAWGKLIHEKNLKSKNLAALSPASFIKSKTIEQKFCE